MVFLYGELADLNNVLQLRLPLLKALASLSNYHKPRVKVLMPMGVKQALSAEATAVNLAVVGCSFLLPVAVQLVSRPKQFSLGRGVFTRS
jgi:hypothetical protein